MILYAYHVVVRLTVRNNRRNKTMTNGQSRDTVNIGHKTHNEHKQKRSTTHIRPREKISNTEEIK